MTDPNRKPQTRKQAAPAGPITRHPLFPAIVALWFAALVSVGSLALSTALLERLVLATGIDTVVAAAAPPLGAKARLLIALGLGTIGAVAGWFLAKRVAEPADKAGPKVFKVAEADLGKPMTAARPAASVDLPVLDPAALDGPPVLADMLVENTAKAIEAEPVSEPADSLSAEPETAIEAEPRLQTGAERIAGAELGELSHVELIERLAIALQRREALIEAGADQDTVIEANPVIQFPDLADRRQLLAVVPASPPRVAPQETEKALRDALSQLQRMSGTRG